MQNAVRGTVSLCAFYLVERKNQVEHGIGSWLSLLISLSFLQFTVILTPPDFFGMTTSGLEYGEVECWISPAARY